MTPAELAERLERKGNAIPREIAFARSRTGHKGVTIAHGWSSGTESSAALRARGHPYAKRHGSGSASPLINRQEGSFFAGWHFDAGRSALVNPHGSFLQQGTAAMVPRDIVGAIRRDLRPILRAEARTALERSLRA